MKIFIRRFLLFIWPLVVIMLLPLFVLVRSGELIPESEIIARQSTASSSILVGKAYIPISNDFTLRSVEIQRPEVLALGNSRILEIRSEFFRSGVKFYNAGSSIATAGQFRTFLDRLKSDGTPLPRVIIICLDQTFFHPMWTESVLVDFNQQNSPPLSKTQLFGTVWKKIYQDFIKGKFTVGDILKSTDDIGLAAVVQKNGTRNDGSHYYGSFIQNPTDPKNEDYQFRDTLDRIAKGERRFEIGSDISNAAIREIGLFLDEASKNGITVVGYLPPYPHIIYQRLKDSGDSYAYMWKIMPALKPIFDKYRFELFDFTDLKSIGGSDTEAIDGFHVSEKATLRYFIAMATAEAKLSRLVDLTDLKKNLDLTANPLFVFEN